MTQNIAEIVTFKLMPGVSQDDYIGLSKTINDFIETCPGFLFRRLSSGEDGRWTDTAIWSNIETAKAAAEAFPQQSFAPKIMAAIDADTLEMRHEAIHFTQFPAQTS
jgi:predicted sugar kinase